MSDTPRYRYDARKVLSFGERLCRDAGRYPSSRAIGEALGVSPRCVIRWRTCAFRSVRSLIVDAIEFRYGVWVGEFEFDDEETVA